METNATVEKAATVRFEEEMRVIFLIHLDKFKCSCFSEQDLAVNIEFALKQGDKIVGVEATMTGYDKIRLSALETIYWFSDQFNWSWKEEMLIEIDLEKLLRRIR